MVEPMGRAGFAIERGWTGQDDDDGTDARSEDQHGRERQDLDGQDSRGAWDGRTEEEDGRDGDEETTDMQDTSQHTRDIHRRARHESFMPEGAPALQPLGYPWLAPREDQAMN